MRTYTATELRDNMKEALDHASKHMVLITRGGQEFALKPLGGVMNQESLLRRIEALEGRMVVNEHDTKRLINLAMQQDA